jgi:hypothetical protein
MDLPVDVRPLYDLEIAALNAIASDYGNVEPQLSGLFRSCTVTNYENTGSGFFAGLASNSSGFAPLKLRSPLGDACFKIEGMRVGICCLVFLTDGYPTLLECYSPAGERTSKIDFGTAKFEFRSELPTE